MSADKFYIDRRGKMWRFPWGNMTLWDKARVTYALYMLDFFDAVACWSKRMQYCWARRAEKRKARKNRRAPLKPALPAATPEECAKIGAALDGVARIIRDTPVMEDTDAI